MEAPLSCVRVLSVALPPEARREACALRWWQPAHSGAGRDVWALDDVAVTASMYNAVNINLTSALDVDQALEFHLGEIGLYCGREDALRCLSNFSLRLRIL